jgi:hypothetical protein
MRTRSIADDLATGRVVDQRAHRTVPYTLTPREMAAYERAKTAGYLVCASRRPNGENVWWRWCEERQHPYVIVRPGTTSAAVHYDLLVIDRTLTEAGRAAIVQIMRAWAIRPRTRRTIGILGAVTGMVLVHRADAEAAARAVVATLQQPGALTRDALDTDTP